MNLGQIVLLGSGETSPSIRKVYNWLFEQIEDDIRVAILETPAGFEPNAEAVADQIRQYVAKRLQNYNPAIELVPARKRGTEFSTDDPSILGALYDANVIMMGPGSPTYAARQLAESTAWQTLQANHRLGAHLVFASATTLASSVHVLPVYEIYKVGEELHWKNGLNFFKPYGLSLIFIPHWNNNDGGSELDTSRCYVGQNRYEQLMALLDHHHVDDHRDDHAEHVVVGIDENTALIVDPAKACCRVMGPGGVTIVREGEERFFESGQTFDASELGPFRLPLESEMIPGDVWVRTQEERAAAAERRAATPEPTAEVLDLVEQRTAARASRDWAEADRLRDRLAERGWQVQDTPEGPVVEPV